MCAFYRSKHELIFILKNGNAPHINAFELVIDRLCHIVRFSVMTCNQLGLAASCLRNRLYGSVRVAIVFDVRHRLRREFSPQCFS